MQCGRRSFNFDSRKAPVSVQWFIGAQTNLAYNCLDRNVETGHGERVAFYWEGNDLGEDSTTTYSELLARVRSTGCGSLWNKGLGFKSRLRCRCTWRWTPRELLAQARSKASPPCMIVTVRTARGAGRQGVRGPQSHARGLCVRYIRCYQSLAGSISERLPTAALQGQALGVTYARNIRAVLACCSVQLSEGWQNVGAVRRSSVSRLRLGAAGFPDSQYPGGHVCGPRR